MSGEPDGWSQVLGGWIQCIKLPKDTGISLDDVLSPSAHLYMFLCFVV